MLNKKFFTIHLSLRFRSSIKIHAAVLIEPASQAPTRMAGARLVEHSDTS